VKTGRKCTNDEECGINSNCDAGNGEVAAGNDCDETSHCVTHSKCMENEEGRTCTCFQGFVADDITVMDTPADTITDWEVQSWGYETAWRNVSPLNSQLELNAQVQQQRASRIHPAKEMGMFPHALASRDL
ncbi:unnamed protein product, partial [Darwinula stevensoni]